MSYRPNSHPSVSPFFLVHDGPGFIEFLKAAFGAHEVSRMSKPDGTIVHCTISIDGSIIMLGVREKTSQNSTHLYVKDVDTTYALCLSLGAQSISEPKTFPYGDRSAGLLDAFGNTWWIGTHLKASGSAP